MRGAAPLHHVRNLACAKILLQYDANALARNNFGHTTLISVTRSKDCVSLCEVLVEAGVDVNARDYGDETALCNGFVYIEKLTETVRFLLDQGANMSLVTAARDTVAHFAVEHNAHEILCLLLDRGVDYNPQTSYGQTILHTAARMADIRTIEILQRNGIERIDFLVKDCHGKTAMDYANERSPETMDEDFRDVFKMLHRSIVEKQMQVLSGGAGLEKDASVTCLTPLSDEEMAAEVEDLVLEELVLDNNEGHGTAVYYDAPEHLEGRHVSIVAV